MSDAISKAIEVLTEYDELLECMSPGAEMHGPRTRCQEAMAALQHAGRGDITVTKNEAGIACVTRCDEDGRILSILSESAPQPAVPDDVLVKPELSGLHALLDELIKAGEAEAWRYPTVWEPLMKRVKALLSAGKEEQNE
jgi:hypothetical protein